MYLPTSITSITKNSWQQPQRLFSKHCLMFGYTVTKCAVLCTPTKASKIEIFNIFLLWPCKQFSRWMMHHNDITRCNPVHIYIEIACVQCGSCGSHKPTLPPIIPESQPSAENASLQDKVLSFALQRGVLMFHWRGPSFLGKRWFVISGRFSLCVRQVKSRRKRYRHKTDKCRAMGLRFCCLLKFVFGHIFKICQ